MSIVQSMWCLGGNCPIDLPVSKSPSRGSDGRYVTKLGDPSLAVGVVASEGYIVVGSVLVLAILGSLDVCWWRQQLLLA